MDEQLGAAMVHVWFDNGAEVIAPMLFIEDFDDYLRKVLAIGRNLPILDPVGRTDEESEWGLFFDDIDSDECASVQSEHLVRIEEATDEESDMWFEMTERDEGWINEKLGIFNDRVDMSWINRIDSSKIIVH